ncbi:MAG: thiolase family protein [Rhodospirillales bacterium]|nr:thiolase family protein [Rhodospirillales bacterium]
MTGDAAVIVAARRAPIGRIGGSLRHLDVAALAAPVLQAVLADARLTPTEVDDVILGNAAGPGGNPGRLAALTAGFPVSTPGVTVDRQCGSGLEAITIAARLIAAGAGDVYIAGGVESASTAPWRLERPGSPYGAPRLYQRARFAPDTIGDPEMGVAAENVARQYGISRERQDRYALASHQKAVQSQQEGRFAGEIVPMRGADGAPVSVDECPRGDTSFAALASLPPVFVPGGTVTAGNACPINDGAAAVVVVSERRFRKMRFAAGLRVIDSAAAGVDPNLLGAGPIASTHKLFARLADRRLADVDVVEFNEAFAAQVLACLDALEIPQDKVSIGGGAIALGHPWGASGAILVVRLFTELVRRPTDARTALATLGIAGGLGISALFETA